ncbi:hypothetical protein [Sphaerisporangium corydalis]|uniref:Uncharacterized protein n=1 Tax=Sphaerisporangium corydalis TaxID=1441875 RepID=A0ABV9EAB1_9ACTN|nr:hypothetical protein [Sphaerisporangium corydalis]
MDDTEHKTQNLSGETDSPAAKISIRLLDKIETTNTYSGNSNS